MDMHIHAGSEFDDCMTLTLDLLRQCQCMPSDADCHVLYVVISSLLIAQIVFIVERGHTETDKVKERH